jgi:hypothetical protein
MRKSRAVLLAKMKGFYGKRLKVLSRQCSVDGILYDVARLESYDLMLLDDYCIAAFGISPLARASGSDGKFTEAGNFYIFAPFQNGFHNVEHALYDMSAIGF